jgi:hypothetical protein
MVRQAFSDELEAWLRSEDAKTVGSRGRVFQEEELSQSPCAVDVSARDPGADRRFMRATVIGINRLAWRC